MGFYAIWYMSNGTGGQESPWISIGFEYVGLIDSGAAGA